MGTCQRHHLPNATDNCLSDQCRNVQAMPHLHLDCRDKRRVPTAVSPRIMSGETWALASKLISTEENQLVSKKDQKLHHLWKDSHQISSYIRVDEDGKRLNGRF